METAMSQDAQTQYNAVAAELSSSLAATTGKMFGMPSLFIGGKAFAGLSGDTMVFKLGGSAHEEALALPGAVLFDPSGRGRPMKEWVVVPSDLADRWADLGQQALQYVADRR
jgi:hypothetical protein